MARILVFHNSNLDRTWREVAAGRAPNHFLYGVDYFAEWGHELRIAPYRRSRWLHAASRALQRSPIPLGDLDQEASVLRMAHDCDLIYSPSQNAGHLLGYLRAVGRLRRPIVWLIHHPFDRGRLSRPRRPLMRAMLGGVDGYPALSPALADELAAIAGRSDRTAHVQWGPDPNWYPPAEGGRGVVAVGRTKRDFDTFALAAAQTDVPAWIVCDDPPRTPASPNTTVITDPSGNALTHSEIVALYARTRAVAIPLRVEWPWSVNGLLSLMDALGMGKPVIVTRNPWIDIDVEQLGIGIWVEPGDVDGWRNAIRYLDERPDVADEMGRRARALVDDGVRSSRTFAQQVMQVFERVLAQAS